MVVLLESLATVSLIGAIALWAHFFAILAKGGCCSGMGRILIVSFDLLGVRAAQIALNQRSDLYQHCIVEAWVDGSPILLDPDYGLQFVSSTGESIGLEALQAGVQPRLLPLPGKEAATYPDSPIYDWDYARTGTMNWTKSLPRRLVYRVLNLLTRGAINRWRHPVVLEWPHPVLATALVVAAGRFEAAAFFLRR